MHKEAQNIEKSVERGRTYNNSTRQNPHCPREARMEGGHKGCVFVCVNDKVLLLHTHVSAFLFFAITVTFPKEGDQGPNNIPADVVFVIKYKNHPRFTRKGNDLHHTADVKLADALCGCGISLLTLDGRDITIPVNDVITPSYTKRVEREGMPHSKNTKEKGDLILHFNLIFPRNLSQKQKQLVRAGLNNDNNNNNDNILYIVVNNCI
eukprot:m.167727 g.167727  ORF g.167727 m.167727 type:complete len:208 (-) comp13464_c2_seq23:2086-2709(-)